MNINDPFGRMASKHQKEYDALRESFTNMGINTPEAAQELIEKLKKRGKMGVAVIAAGTLILTLLLQELMALILLIGAVAVFWLIKTSQKSQDYVRKYLKEEIEGNKEERSTQESKTGSPIGIGDDDN